MFVWYHLYHANHQICFYHPISANTNATPQTPERYSCRVSELASQHPALHAVVVLLLHVLCLLCACCCTLLLLVLLHAVCALAVSRCHWCWQFLALHGMLCWSQTGGINILSVLPCSACCCQHADDIQLTFAQYGMSTAYASTIYPPPQGDGMWCGMGCALGVCTQI